MKLFLLLGTCLLGLVGCAPAPSTRLPPGVGAGLVYASLPGRDGVDSITVQSLDGSASYPLDIAQEGAARLVEAWLPAGDYKFAKWDGLPFGDYQSFHVEAGRMTNLGSLVPVAIGDYKFVVLPLRAAAGDANLQTVQSAFASKLHGDPLEWNPSVPPHPIEEPQASTHLGLIADLLMSYQRKLNQPPLRQQLAESKSSQAFFDVAKATVPPVTQTGVTDAKGDLLYGSDFGQIRLRHPNAVWTSIDSGVLASVTAVAVRGDLLLAGYGDGEIRTSSDDGATWINAATLPGGDPVIDISWSGKRWLATTSGPSKAVNVYATAGNSPTHFSSIRQLTAKWGSHIRGQLSQGAYYVNADPGLYRLDLASMQWSKLQTPTDVHGFSFSPDGRLLTIFRAQGIFSKVYVSSDSGASWKQRKAPPLVIEDVKFTDPDQGIAVRARPNMFTVSVMLMRYEPDADHWTVFNQPPAECERMIDDASGSPKFCIARGGAVLGQDDGKWLVESAAY
ncbi:MAG: sialidase family protein [Rhodanobacter sp.]